MLIDDACCVVLLQSLACTPKLYFVVPACPWTEGTLTTVITVKKQQVFSTDVGVSQVRGNKKTVLTVLYDTSPLCKCCYFC